VVGCARMDIGIQLLEFGERKEMRNAEIIAGILLFCSAACLTSCRHSSGLQDAEKVVKAGPAIVPQGRDSFRWPEGIRAAISLTFDDARLSQVDRGLAILDAHSTKATFYVVPNGVEQRLAGWKKAVVNGHEIGNHTLKHPCSGNFSWSRKKALENYTLAEMGRELDEANAAIERLLGVKPMTFAYPCGQKFVGRGPAVRSYVPLIAERFIVGRGAFDEIANDPAFCDLAQATGISLDGLYFEQAKQLIDKAAAEGRWLIFFGHEIGPPAHQTTVASTLEALCEYAQDPANELWIDTVDTIGKYIRDQRKGAKQ
jgi:peptidoglycan/xylan/chitin deacetylase (PgdA/CDA1 family)